MRSSHFRGAFSVLLAAFFSLSLMIQIAARKDEPTARRHFETPVADAPAVGKYLCYYYGYNYALTSSSLTEIEILPRQKMKIVGETTGFRLEGSILTLLEGEFKGATAHLKTSDGKPAIVFIRKENEAKGHKIDVSDTWCYLDK